MLIFDLDLIVTLTDLHKSVNYHWENEELKMIQSNNPYEYQSNVSSLNLNFYLCIIQLICHLKTIEMK